jgi:MFS family permease
MSSSTLRSPLPATASRPARRTAGHGAGFWLVALAFLATMAFSTVPAPLYPLYQAEDGFSTFTITVVFAAYAVGVALSLVLAGHVSDWVGRKRALVPALVLELVAAALFLSGTGLVTLLVARFVGGLGVGVLTATATAHLQELHRRHRPGASPLRPQVVATVANIGGLGLGALVGGVLAEHLGAPLRLPYAVFAVLLLAGLVGVLLAPETVERPAVRPAYRPQRPRRAGADPFRQALALAAAFAAFAVFGVFTSVAPGFVSGTLHHSSRVLAGLVVFLVFGSAAAAQALTVRTGSTLKLQLGVLAQAVGLVVLVVGMRTAVLGLFLAGGVLTGVGAGLLFASAVGTVGALAGDERRGEALAGLFLVAYLGMSLPALALGVAARWVPATAAMTVLAAVLVAVLAVLGLASRRRRR